MHSITFMHYIKWANILHFAPHALVKKRKGSSKQDGILLPKLPGLHKVTLTTFFWHTDRVYLVLSRLLCSPPTHPIWLQWQCQLRLFFTAPIFKMGRRGIFTFFAPTWMGLYIKHPSIQVLDRKPNYFCRNSSPQNGALKIQKSTTFTYIYI